MNVTVDKAMNPLPVIVSVSELLPAVAEEGDRPVTVGWGLPTACTVKVNGAEVPPLGAGLVTVMGKVPPVAKPPAGRVTVTWLVLTKVVGRVVPLKLTVAPGAKFVPVSVSVAPKLPAATEAGVMFVMAGVV